MAEARAARLAAVEARLAGTPSTSTSSSKAEMKKLEDKFEPTEKGDIEKKKEFTKLLFRGVVRDNGYKEASGCVDTLIKISSNILSNPSEAKYRELKAANNTIKSKVLDVKSGHDYLILLGFRTRTVEFEKQYILEPTLRRLHELKLGDEVLSEAAPDLRSRLTSVTASNTNHQSDEAARRARALAEYEADRDLVKERVKREKIVREVREAKAKEAAEAAAAEPQDLQSQSHEIDDDEEYGQEEEDDETDEDDDEDDEDGSRRYARQQRRAGRGQKLGGGQVLGK